MYEGREIGKFCVTVLTLMICFSQVRSQEMLGTVLGNYAGIQAAQINPSALQGQKTWLDVHLVGADLFLQNNFLFMRKEDYRFGNFFKAGYEWPTHEESYGTESRVFYYYNNTWPKDVFINLRINGPGAMVVWGNHAFGITTAFRSVLSVHNLPYEVAKFSYLGLNYRPQHNIHYIENRPFSIAAMAWGEIGLSYAGIIHARGYNEWTGGITLKRLMGYAGGYAYVKQLDFIVPDDSTLIVNNLDATMGMSLPVSFDNMDNWGDKMFKGGGFGVDLGVTYTRLGKGHTSQYVTKLCEQRYEDYIYRIGFSLIDIGAVRFRYNSRKYQIDNRSSYWSNLTSLNFSSVGHLMDTISYKFYGDSAAALTGERFTLWLPSALSLQADYHLKHNWYVNACLIYGFRLSHASLSRPAQLAITPRYESDWLEVNMPVSLYDWSLIRIGLSLRVYGITIGTEKLGGYLHLSDFTGMDFYFSVRFFLEKGKCRMGKMKNCLDREAEGRRSKF